MKAKINLLIYSLMLFALNFQGVKLNAQQCAENSSTQIIGPSTMSFSTSTYLHTVTTPISTPIDDFNFTVTRIGTSNGIYWASTPRLTVYSQGSTRRGGTFVFNALYKEFYLFVGNLASFDGNTKYEEAQITAYDVNNNPVKYTSFTEHSGYEAATQVFNSGRNNATSTINGRGESDGVGTARVTFYFATPISKISITSMHSVANEESLTDISFSGGCSVSKSLPVNFGNVIAEIKGGFLNVNWQTTTEENNDYFEIEVSKDGKTWSKAGKDIDSKTTNGNSEVSIDYHQSIPLSGMTIMGVSLFLLSISMMFRRNKWLGAILVVAGMSAMLYGCSKNNEDVKTNEYEKLFVRIKQVNTNGGSTLSNVITAVAK